jgi:hypothetical protein
VGRKNTPAVPNPHPDIGQPVVIFVRFAIRLSAFVIGASYHGNVAAANPHPEVGQFGNFHPNRLVCTVRNITRFAVSVAILDGNHEIFRQERRQNIDLSFFVRLGPSLFEPAYLCHFAGPLLRGRGNGQTKEQAKSQPGCHG